MALHLRSGVYFELDRTAVEIVRLVNEHGRLRAAEVLSARYGESRQKMATDVDAVIDTIQKASVGATARGRRPTLRGAALVARGWGRLPLSSKLATAQAAALVTVIEILIHTKPLDWVAGRLGVPLLVDQFSVGLSPLDVETLGDLERRQLNSLAWVHRAWLYDATCLRRALASGWILRRRGPALCLGLAAAEGVLAHAWLVVEGHTLDALPQARPFTRLIDAPPTAQVSCG